MLFRLETREASCQTIVDSIQEPEMALCEKVVIALGSALSRSTVTMPRRRSALSSIQGSSIRDLICSCINSIRTHNLRTISGQRGYSSVLLLHAALEDTYSDAAVFETI
jgi:hypothetical protein